MHHGKMHLQVPLLRSKPRGVRSECCILEYMVGDTSLCIYEVDMNIQSRFGPDSL